MLAGAEQLGIAGPALTELADLFDGGDCAAVQQRLAALVAERLQAAEQAVVEQIEHTALRQHQAGAAGADGQAVAALQSTTAELTGQVARLQAAAQHLAAPARTGACEAQCACLSAASAITTPRIPVARAALTLADDVAADGPDIVCTLGGGVEAMRERVSQWQAALAPATGRTPIAGGLQLTYAHDEALAAELARLAAAEFACCSFFTFTLTVGPGGMTFAVTAPPAAGELVTAVFGTADAAAARKSV
ncbi:MerR family transcriptional regulator [Planomonospora venezuelensis]|nr:MerR family transcriptional regulator [Planomonospora venezuelensis]